MSKQTAKKMSNQSTMHKVKFSQLKPENTRFSEIQLKTPGSLRLWNVNYSVNDKVVLDENAPQINIFGK